MSIYNCSIEIQKFSCLTITWNPFISLDKRFIKIEYFPLFSCKWLFHSMMLLFVVKSFDIVLIMHRIARDYFVIKTKYDLSDNLKTLERNCRAKIQEFPVYTFRWKCSNFGEEVATVYSLGELLQKKMITFYFTINIFHMLYYVNKNSQSNWDHEVHISSCSRLPDASNRLYLWDFSSCKDAVAAAKKYYSQSDGCYYCSPTCHTS